MALTGKAVEALLKNLPKAAPMAKREIKKFEKFIDKQTKVQKKVQKTEVKANARGLKAAQGKSLAPKGYKPDAAGRTQVKRFAAPLEKANGKKTSMRLGAQTVDIGRTSLKIKAAPKNRGK